METTEIYKKLKQLRKERGLTLNTLAEKIGSDYQQISRIERGRSKLSVDLLMKMANALETPVAEIVQNGQKQKVIPSKKDLSSEEILKIVLEKVESAIQETKRQLSPSTKASLVSQIYNYASQLYKEKVDRNSMEKFLDFCTEMMSTLIK